MGRKGKVLSAREQSEAVRLSAQGLGLHDIARVLGRSSQPIRAVLRGDYHPTEGITEAERDQMAAWAAEGLGAEAIAERTGFHPGSVRRACGPCPAGGQLVPGARPLDVGRA